MRPQQTPQSKVRLVWRGALTMSQVGKALRRQQDGLDAVWMNDSSGPTA